MELPVALWLLTASRKLGILKLWPEIAYFKCFNFPLSLRLNKSYFYTKNKIFGLA